MAMVEVGLRVFFILILILLILVPPACRATEENDLWLLLSSYEDIGITANDLAFFLVTHGYNAEPVKDYVEVTLKDGKKVYLTPNGASPRLADLWMTPPTTKTGPVKVISSDAIKINATYNESKNADFIKAINRYAIFPLTPLGMCYDGSQKAYSTYTGFGYHVIYMYDPSGFAFQGHLWVAVEDKDHEGKYLAVDSYYGVMTEEEYYKAPYSFADFKYLDSINPKWRMA
ncbi:Uncharacterised protein [uncultured archaeon]|nr:Uncharacterised protein [uncultured archaeon]